MTPLLSDEDFGNNVILDIQSIIVDTGSAKQPTSVKPKLSGATTFIGIRSKISKSSAFKPPWVVKESAYKSNNRDPVSCFMV